jgi:hypothetical protein
LPREPFGLAFTGNLFYFFSTLQIIFLLFSQENNLSQGTYTPLWGVISLLDSAPVNAYFIGSGAGHSE